MDIRLMKCLLMIQWFMIRFLSQSHTKTGTIRNIVEEATSLGVAVLAASGAGIFPDIAKAAESLCKVDKKWLPNNERHEIYEKFYRFSYDMYELINSRSLYKKFDILNQNKDLG